MPALDSRALSAFVDRKWSEDIVPRLIDYIRIPCKSPHFDVQWQGNGHIEAAIDLAHRWCSAQQVPGMQLEILRLPGRTPVLVSTFPRRVRRRQAPC
jgi:hypothetical protein